MRHLVMNTPPLLGCKGLRNTIFLGLVAWGCVFWMVRGSVQTLAAETWDTFKVVAQFPHDPAAFTQGFVIHEGRLLESTGLFGGDSSLREIDMGTGRLLRAFYLPSDFFTEGLAVGGGAARATHLEAGSRPCLRPEYLGASAIFCLSGRRVGSDP